MKHLGRAAIGLALLAAAGCSSGLQPALPMPMTFIMLSGNFDHGKLESPDPNQTVTLKPNTVLRVEAAQYSGFEWRFGDPQDTKTLSFLEREAPGPCPTGTTACVSTQAEQYRADAAGTTKIVFTLAATGTGRVLGTVTLTVTVS
ncbi:MAG TPA: hypothetical protein VL551_01775 [Actinospica sp.]|jgi:hypothetical protein|nr:hypothetical protein [Actinospica sp.]